MVVSEHDVEIQKLKKSIKADVIEFEKMSLFPSIEKVRANLLRSVISSRRYRKLSTLANWNPGTVIRIAFSSRRLRWAGV